MCCTKKGIEVVAVIFKTVDVENDTIFKVNAGTLDSGITAEELIEVDPTFEIVSNDNGQKFLVQTKATNMSSTVYVGNPMSSTAKVGEIIGDVEYLHIFGRRYPRPAVS